MLTSVDILGVRVHSGTTDAVIAHIDDRLRSGAETRIAFLNAHLSNQCARDRDMQRGLRNFLVLNDGVGLDLARWLLHGASFRDNLNGTDFVPAFLDRTALDLKIYLLGAHIDVVARAAERLNRQWPRHEVVGYHHGFLDEDSEAAVARDIAQTHAGMVLVGMGNPRQEQWIARHIPQASPCAMAIGAWFDFYSSSIPRAPLWVRNLRAEWAYRLWREPRRLARRYLVGNGVFLARLATGWLAQQAGADRDVRRDGRS
ncbi:WecB/TagA/CpsF family glycosyltransferase [Labrys portucalensis]|uniref:WecB/TagA/CpsF family glycosyltransferase n=1 Tax=Labrys neptuniae TaxID=376174 RepID=A0ABV6ZQE4_9HYPH